jgi:hypothetical protein
MKADSRGHPASKYPEPTNRQIFHNGAEDGLTSAIEHHLDRLIDWNHPVVSNLFLTPKVGFSPLYYQVAING